MQLTTLLTALDDGAWSAPAGGGFDGSLGLGVEALLFDAVVHGDDIAAATGLAYEKTNDGVVACVSHVAHFLGERGWGPALLCLNDVPEVPIGNPKPADRVVKGDPFTFVLAATGRIDPAT